MHEKLTGYVEAIREGKLSDAALARTAGVKVSDVAAARVELGKSAGHVCPACKVAPVAHAGEACEACAMGALREHGWVKQDPVTGAEYMDGHRDPKPAAPVAASEATPVRMTAPPAPEAPSEPPPRAVRITKSLDAPGPDRRTTHFGFRGVYTGDLAAWLWTHHRGHVEAYAPKG